MSAASDRHWRLRAIFDEALLREAGARDAYIDDACAGDPELRLEVMRLVAAHQDPRSFLEHPPDVLLSAAFCDEPFAGTERFRVVQRLGAGGMGVVYEAQDRVRDEIVALKTLHRTGAADVYRLKREFRSLVDVAHANLVCLYELFVEDERCFFTMELVDGISFVDYVRSADRTDRFGDRLVDALRQLVDAVSALHQSGKLHRDIKPSNVLVTPEGRVVVLDFGLIAELQPQPGGEVTYVIGGTPAYMSPEEVSGATPSRAGDWYGIGVTLYEALTGAIPFAGPIDEVLVRKTTSDPRAPAQVSPDVPTDVSAVCMGLLCRDPARRLSGHEALRRLARDATPYRLQSASVPLRDAPFVGRDHQLRALHGAFDAAASGTAAAVFVYGPSGIGKSALVRTFLSRVSASDNVVVLSGRCYENESVPYKALDGVVDDLSRYLGSISRQDVANLVPDEVPALTRVFPVLLQVGGIADLRQGRSLENADPLALRRRAFSALRTLLAQLSSRQPLVMFIDDLQWADADSSVLLEELLRPPNPPAMLTLACFRSEETAAKPFLKRLLERAGRDIWSAIQLDPMGEDEAQTLIGALLPPDSALSTDDRRRMTREASGSPFVLEQLARYAGSNLIEPHRAPTFSEAFDTRLGALPADARRFLETLAVCGRPMAPELVFEACRITRDRRSLIAMLRSSQFIRSSGSSERIEAYHDRIREVLAAQVGPDAARRIHSLMVGVLVERRSDDCEALFEHYRGAGDSENAATQAGLAAEKASAALAFGRAASLYGDALALAPASAAASGWKAGLADALANAGRPSEAADAYLRAADGAGHAERVELQRRGAEQFLIAGDIDRGLEIIRAVLGKMGMGVPRSPRTALLWLLWRRTKLRWRGLSFVPTQVSDVDAEMLLRIDTCWSATTGLLLVDTIAASDFSARHLLMALDAGEPSRIARGMAIESAARIAYRSGSRSNDRFIQHAKTLAQSVGSPHAVALSLLADAIIAVQAGEWKRTSTLSEQAVRILRDQCRRVTWELNIAQNLRIWSLMYQGELGELLRQIPAMLAAARSSGNLYIATELCTRSNFAWLATDNPDEGEREVVDSIGRWSQKGFHRQHYSARLARVQTALYRGDADGAWRLFIEQEAMLRRSLLTHVQVLRIEALYLRSRVALAMAARHGPRRFLSDARAAARRIARERRPWSDPIALLLSAAVAYLERDTPLALTYLHDAADRFVRADMNLYAAIARRRIGGLQNDGHGREVLCRADEWMAAQHIENPVAMTRMLAPGFPDA
jgi:eukaryotic-like serine/threonine-protein kinase